MANSIGPKALPPIQSSIMMRLSMLTVLAVAFRAAEIVIPTPLPWLKIGLANAVILVVLKMHGSKAALLVNISRILLASLVLGTFLSPGFWLSLGAGLTSCISMITVWACLGKWLSDIGISVVGAYVHTMTQFALAYLLFVKHIAILELMPYFLLVSLVSGAATGALATAMLSWAKRHGMQTMQSANCEANTEC
ncbi:Gx transporter family protein [bacterium]|nr:Gx transporter family protein [bacterium]